MAGFYDLAEGSMSLFCSRIWLEALPGETLKFGIYDRQDNLIGGFVAARLSLRGISVLSQPSLTPHCGLFFQNNAKNMAKQQGFVKVLFKCLADFLKSYKVKAVQLAFPPEYSDLQPFYWANFKVVPKYTYRLDLTLSLENIKSNMAPERRNVLQKAETEGIVLSSCETESSLALIAHRWSSKSLKLPVEGLRRLFRVFHGGPQAIACCGSKEKLLATVFCVHNQQTCYYIAGAYDASAESNAAGSLCLFSAIAEAKGKGLQIFDFEGSMIPEVERYFRSFGAEIRPYYTVNRASFWVEILFKIFRRNYF